MEGWIKLHRKFLNWEWYTDTNTKSIFVHLLLTANHKPNRYKGIALKRGQLVTGIQKISLQTGVSIQSTRTALKRLKATHEITTQSTNKGSLITICKYDRYNPPNTPPPALAPHPNQQPINPTPTSPQHAINIESTTNKKERRKEGKECKEVCEEADTHTVKKQVVKNSDVNRRKSGTEAPLLGPRTKVLVQVKNAEVNAAWANFLSRHSIGLTLDQQKSQVDLMESQNFDPTFLIQRIKLSEAKGWDFAVYGDSLATIYAQWQNRNKFINQKNHNNNGTINQFKQEAYDQLIEADTEGKDLWDV